jgi:malonyl-CoA O-methyltransferase
LLIREASLIFNQSASDYERYAGFSQEVGERLIERLDYFKIEPNYILDLGCALGFFSKLLRKRYPKATVVSLDIAWMMLKKCQKGYRFLKRQSLVCADMHKLPFQNKQFDLIFMNQVLQWSVSMDTLLAELHRIMKPGAGLIFSTLGPDTCKELKDFPEVLMPASFVDMHCVGDAMVQAGFDDPVLDMEMLTVRYRKFKTLLRTLKIYGVEIPDVFEQKKLLSCSEGRYPVTFEAIYGLGWRGEDKQKTRGHETFIPLDALFNKKSG